MTGNHGIGYLRSGKYEIVAISDLSDDAMKEFDERFAEWDDYRAEHFSDALEMLEKSDLDVVSVGVWDIGHAPMTMAAAASGVKGVLCEKPMADTVGAAADMILVCRRNGVKLAIGHQRRWLPAYTLARDLIADGEIGDVRLIQVYARDGSLGARDSDRRQGAGRFRIRERGRGDDSVRADPEARLGRAYLRQRRHDRPDAGRSQDHER